MGMRWGEGLKTMGNVIGNMAQQSRADRQRLEDHQREDQYRASMMGLQQQQIDETARAAGVREQLAQESHDLAQAQVYTDLLAGDQEISQERRDALVKEAPGLLPFLMETPGQPARPDPQAPYGPYVGGQTPYGTERATAQAMLPATPSTYRVALTGEDRRAADLRAHQIDMVGVEAEAEKGLARFRNQLPLTPYESAQIANASRRTDLDERGLTFEEERIALQAATNLLQEQRFKTEKERQKANTALTSAELAMGARNNTFKSFTEGMVGYTGYGDLTEAQRNELERLDRIAEQAQANAFGIVNKYTGFDLYGTDTPTQGGGAASGANGMVDVHTPTPPATPPATPTQQHGYSVVQGEQAIAMGANAGQYDPVTNRHGSVGVPPDMSYDPRHGFITRYDPLLSLGGAINWPKHGEALGRSGAKLADVFTNWPVR